MTIRIEAPGLTIGAAGLTIAPPVLTVDLPDAPRRLARLAMRVAGRLAR